MNTANESFAFAINTHERPEECTAAIDAIRVHYPDAPIWVADDSKIPSAWNMLAGVHQVPTPYDVGVSAKRNALADAIDEKYTILLDDDMLISGSSMVPAMIATLRFYPNMKIAGCRKYDGGRRRWANSEAVMVQGHGSLNLLKPSHWISEGAMAVDFVPMCICAETSFLRRVRFDEQFKTCGEHLDFFLRVKYEVAPKGISKVAFMPHFEVYDGGSRPLAYKQQRRRGSRYRRMMKDKWSLKKINAWNARLKAKVSYE